MHLSPSEEGLRPSLPDHGLSETTPLLHLASAPKPHYQDEEGGRIVSRAQELRDIVASSVPLIITYFLQRSINIVGIFLAGKIGTVELAAVCAASLTTSMIGNTAIQGLANGLDTLAAQAYGSGNKDLVGLHMLRMILFILPCTLPLMAVWWEADVLLGFIIPDRRVTELAGLYLKIMTLRVPAFTCFECSKRFLQAQGLFSAAVYVLAIAAPLNALLMWYLVWHLGWGFVGAPVAIAFTENLMAVMMFLYIWLVEGSDCWGGFTRRAFVNWGPMIRLAVPSMIMQMTECAVEEVLTLVAAQFGTSQLAAQSALVTLVQIIYIVPMGVSGAVAFQVAKNIGAGAIQAAKRSSQLAVGLGLGISLLNAGALAALRSQIPLFFSHNQNVIDILSNAISIIILMQAFDTLASFSNCLLRGFGYQTFGGYVNLGALYLVALPLSLGSAFGLGWQLYGLWGGLTVGLFFVPAIEFTWLLYRADWDIAVEKAAFRNQLD